MKNRRKLVKIFAIVFAIVLSCLFMTSCSEAWPHYGRFWRELSPKGTITVAEGEENVIIYKEMRYVEERNNNGKINILDFNSDNCVKIATLPRSYILAAVDVFYADSYDNPTIIYLIRNGQLWVKEGMDIDEMIMNNNAVISDSFSFRINDVITGEIFPYRETRDKAYDLYTFRSIHLEDFPMFTYYVIIASIDGELYLQYVWDSDYYKITDEFANALYQNGYLS
ncbi:MAG: hypothetical protein J6A90_02805 [Clostridia bacterium]|nr:hypothetical protein [Clostridia bacterium]